MGHGTPAMASFAVEDSGRPHFYRAARAPIIAVARVKPRLGGPARLDGWLTPAPGCRTWRHPAPRAPACPPTPRIGRRGNTARTHRARWRATPRIGGPRLRRRR